FGGLVGARYQNPEGDLFAELGAGLLYRDYAADSLDDIFFPGFRAEVRYRPNDDALELRARARTDIRDTDLAAASGFRNARGDLDASYDVADDVTLFAGFGIEWRKFAVESSLANERTDVLASGEAGVRYVFLAPTFLEFKARYDERFSDERAARYDALRLSVSVGAAF
ncbi:MAG: outer membrane beta-barrel protein, partial [Alphaproteobacteria bacterium]